MDAAQFNSSFADIVDLNSSEGPNYNIFEPKFEARRQMQQLLETVANVYKAEKGWLALRQLCRCLVFIGTTMMEVEEDDDGMIEVRRAYALLRLCAAEAADAFPETPLDVDPVPLEDILSAEEPLLLRADLAHTGCVEFVRVHNAMGLYLSKTDAAERATNARTVLERAEAAYAAWDAQFAARPPAPATHDLPVGDNGRLDMAGLGDRDAAACVQRFEMDSAHTATLFFLAQVHALLQDAAPASRYCHLTMYYQLLCKQEFDRKVWAANALQLSGFYSSSFAYGQAMHCLRAGELIMPAEKPDETTHGLVAWAYGRFHLHRLVRYGSERVSPSPVGPAAAPDFSSYWVDFPVAGLEPAAAEPPFTAFDDARAAFKAGNKALQEALTFHPFQSSCTSHIELVQDVSRLYGALDLFEDDRTRRIAMLHRRMDLIAAFPDQLSFNAYPIVVRQLLYDLGYLCEDIIRLRQEQRRLPGRGDKPLKDGPFNELVAQAQGYYTRFVETWRLPQTGQIPDALDAESRLPFFRALMRLAHVALCFSFATPKEEYDAIALTMAAYQRAIDFAAINSPIVGEGGELVDKEVSLAQDMVKLLPNKQRDVWVAYQRTLRQ